MGPNTLIKGQRGIRKRKIRAKDSKIAKIIKGIKSRGCFFNAWIVELNALPMEGDSVDI